MPLATEAELRRALDDGFMSSVLTYDQDKQTRFRVTTQPSVVEYTLDRDVNLLPQGCVMVLIAAVGSKLLDEVQAGLTDAGSTVMRDTIKSLRDHAMKRTVVPAMQAAQTMTSQDCYAELYYGNTFLTGGMFVPDDSGMACVLLPYAGGDLEDERFQLTAYCREVDSPTMSVLIIKRRPELSAAEKAALSQVGSEFSIGAADLASGGFCTPGALFAGLTPGLIVAGAAYAYHHYFGSQTAEGLVISEETIRTIGPTATARDLLAVRRRILIGGQR